MYVDLVWRRGGAGAGHRGRGQRRHRHKLTIASPLPPNKEILHIIKSDLICMCWYIFAKKQIVIAAAVQAQTNNRSIF